MRPVRPLITGVLCLAVTAMSHAAPADQATVAYPDGYRAWHHVKSMVIKPGHPLENPFQGIHHVYANDNALAGLRTGTYADGAVLVFDLLDYTDANSALEEGQRKLVGVMERDSQRFAATGGWGFEGFAGNSPSERLVQDGGEGCFGCHASVADTQYVFSALRD